MDTVLTGGLRAGEGLKQTIRDMNVTEDQQTSEMGRL